MIYRECYALLQLSYRHATSLVPALGMLAGVSHALSIFASCPPQPTNNQFQQYLGQILDRVLDLLNWMTSYFHDLSAGNGNVTEPSGLLRTLGKPLEAFDSTAGQILSEIWTFHTPSGIQGPSLQFKQVQLLLQPQDEMVRTTQKILLAERGSRHEFTCEWFSKPFLDFVRSVDSTFWIDGRSGCGKSALCGWILETLQSHVDGRMYAVDAYTIDPLLPSQTNTPCVIKALLRQMVERQYQSGKLYRALANLMDISTTSDDPLQVDKALWECLEVAIAEVNQPTILVIDGLSELDGGDEAAATLFQNLIRYAAHNHLVRLLVLSRPFAFSSMTPLRRRTIDVGDVRKDISRVITNLVPRDSSIPGAEIARRINHEADGNFFWSLLAFREWKTQNFSQQVWRTLPVSLEGNVISKIDFSDPTTGLVLFNSMIAVRPLRVVELQVMSRLDVPNRLIKPQAAEISHVIKNACKSILIIQDEIVLFRHSLLRQALLDTLQVGNLLLDPEIHTDMACRLLLYVKFVLGQHSELTLKPTSSLALEDLSRAHPLLSYALQYWQKHVTASSMFLEPDLFKPSSDFPAVFPDTVQAASVEASFWQRDLYVESIGKLRSAMSIRSNVLGNHQATLQTIACLSKALRCRKDFTGAATHFYMASEMAQLVLPEFHPFTVMCMQKFLDIIDTADDIKLSEHPSQKADVLRYLVSMYDSQSGPNSDQALEARRSLATHYTAMQEHTLSTDMHQRVHQLTVDRHGKDSTQAKASAHRFVTALQYHSAEDASPYGDSVYDDILQTYDMTDPRRIKSSIAKAEAYRSLDDPSNAELVYVNLWQGIAEACHRQRNLESHEKLIQCGVAYSKFLRDYGRISDSQSVVLGLWSQQQAVGYQSATISVLLGDLAMEMRHADLPELTLDVLHAILACPDTQYKSICSALWGDRNSSTMEAVLSLADVGLSLHPDSIKAMRLYEILVDEEDTIPPDQRKSAKAIIEVAEDRLTDFYQALVKDDAQVTTKADHLQGKAVAATVKHDRHITPSLGHWHGKAIARAVRLLDKRYQKEKTSRGASHPATLAILATWVKFLLVKQDSGSSAAIQELQLAIDSVMDSEAQPSSLYNAAVSLATSFSAHGFVTEGLDIVRRKTEHVMFDDPARRSNLIFLAVIEAHLTESMPDVAEIHANILKLSALRDCYEQARKPGTEPGLTLTCGARLRSFLLQSNRPGRASSVEQDLYDRFLEDYGAAFTERTQTARIFFSVLLEELSCETSQVDIPSLTSAALNNHTGRLLKEGEYTAALSLLVPGFEFLRFVGAFANSTNSTLENFLLLGLMLAVPVDDQVVGDNMSEMSKTVLQETFRQCRFKNYDFSVLPIQRVSDLASVLGRHQRYEDLEVSNHSANIPV